MATLQDLLDKEIQKNLSKDEKNFYGLEDALIEEREKTQSDFGRKAIQIVVATLSGAERISLDEIDLRLKRLTNLRKYLKSAKVGEQEETLVEAAIKRAEDALTKQRRWKKSLFNKSNNIISSSAIDLGALFIAMSGGDPLVGLGVKLVGDMLRARKEKKIAAAQESKETLRQDAEGLSGAETEPSVGMPNMPLGGGDPFGSPLQRDTSGSLGDSDGRVVNLLQDIFLFTEEISDDVKLLVKEAQAASGLRRGSLLDDAESAREGRGGLQLASKGGSGKGTDLGAKKGWSWKDILDVVQTGVLGGLAIGGTALSALSGFGIVGMLGGGLLWAAVDGIAGYFKSEKWGVSNWAGAIGGFFGGTLENQMLNTITNMGKWALIGAGLGSVFPVVGTLLGGLIGAALGGILGYFGGEKIAKFIDGSVEFISQALNNVIDGSISLVKSIFSKIQDIFSSVKLAILGFAVNILRWVQEKDPTGLAGNVIGPMLGVLEEERADTYRDIGQRKVEARKAREAAAKKSEPTPQAITEKTKEERIAERRKRPGERRKERVAASRGQGLQQEPPSGLGSVSTKYETGGRGAGVISTGKGDAGGKSYGTYQLSSTRGQVDAFLASSGYATQFSGLKVGSPDFDAKWKELAATDPKFGEAQHMYIAKTHYDPQVQKLKGEGIDLSGRGAAVQEAIFSTAVQYGPNSGVISKALKGKDLNSMSDSEIVASIQDYKAANVGSNFKSSSASVQASVANRIQNEKRDLLALAQAAPSTIAKDLTSAEKSVQMASNNAAGVNVVNAPTTNNVIAAGGGQSSQPMSGPVGTTSAGGSAITAFG